MPNRDSEIRTYDRNGKLLESRTVSYEVSQEQINDETIRSQAQQALAANRTFIGLATPTNAQIIAHMKSLSRQNNGLIRLILGQLDNTD